MTPLLDNAGYMYAAYIAAAIIYGGYAAVLALRFRRVGRPLRGRDSGL